MGKFCALFLFSVVTLFGAVSYSFSEQAQVIKSTDHTDNEENVAPGAETIKTQKPAEEVSTKEAPGMGAGAGAIATQKSAEEVSPNEAPVTPSEPQSFKLMPHKAIYEVCLHPSKKPNDPTVNNVTGQSSIELIKTKDGWTYKQNLEIQVHYYDGTTTTIERNVASWESPTEISFHIENFRDGASESILQGGAELGEKSEWRVYFQKPEMDGFITDKHLVFPIGHLEKILETLKNGKSVLSDQIVFDATYEAHEPVRINTVIIPLKDKKIMLKNNTLLPSSKLWRLQQALYSIESSNPVPDYEESNIEVFSTGVISAMEITSNEGITVVMNLKELTVYQ